MSLENLRCSLAFACPCSSLLLHVGVTERQNGGRTMNWQVTVCQVDCWKRGEKVDFNPMLLLYLFPALCSGASTPEIILLARMLSLSPLSLSLSLTPSLSPWVQYHVCFGTLVLWCEAEHQACSLGIGSEDVFCCWKGGKSMRMWAPLGGRLRTSVITAVGQHLIREFYVIGPFCTHHTCTENLLGTQACGDIPRVYSLLAGSGKSISITHTRILLLESTWVPWEEIGCEAFVFKSIGSDQGWVLSWQFKK